MFSCRSLHFAFVLPALAPLSAADTLTVGPAGSGAQFTEIQAAIDAARDDDVILVRPGTYQRIVVAKPLRILGDGTGSVTIAADAQGVTVRGIGVGRELVFSGIEVLNIPPTFSFTLQVLLQDCPGTVILHDVIVQSGSEDTGVKVENCSRALVLDSRITGGSGNAFVASGSGIQALNSTLWVANSEITCEHGLVLLTASPGIEVRNTTLHVWRTSIQGGDLAGFVDAERFNPGGDGILAVGSTVNLFGGPNSTVIGGQGGVACDVFCISGAGGSGLKLTESSHARIQSSIPIQGGWDGEHIVQAPPTSVDRTSSLTFDPKVFASLSSSVQQVSVGSSFAVTLDGNPGGYQALYLSLGTGPTASLPGVDGLGLLDRSHLFTMISEVLPPSGTFAATIPVPNVPSLIGSTLFFQNAERFPNVPAIGTSANRFAIGNPVLVTITR